MAYMDQMQPSLPPPWQIGGVPTAHVKQLVLSGCSDLTQAGGETRLRAGFAADELIPEGWEDVIQGAYVEGFVGAQSGEGAGTRATGGVLLELLFPRDLVGTATFQEGSQWSVDLQWEP